MQHKTKQFHADREKLVQKTMEDRVSDLPFKISPLFPCRLSIFAVLNQNRWFLSKQQIEIFSDCNWKRNLVDFAAKRNRLFSDWWRKRNKT